MDYQALANRLGLIHGETELMDFAAFNETTLGRAMEQFNIGGQPMILTVAQRIFGDFDRINKFAAERLGSRFGGNDYVYWVKDKQESAIATFEECQEEIEKFWKHGKMVELATAKAREMADEANSKQQPLKELYGENVTQTGEFSWFSSFSQTGFGQPIGVKNPGQDFMKAVFALKTNEAGVAINDDQSVVYVVRMISDRKGLEKIGTDYVEKQYLPRKTIPRDVMTLSQQYAQEYHEEWIRELHEEMGLKLLGR
jgi:hypothetical protein